MHGMVMIPCLRVPYSCSIVQPFTLAVAPQATLRSHAIELFGIEQCGGEVDHVNDL
jgi:hypothetical protein